MSVATIDADTTTASWDIGDVLRGRPRAAFTSATRLDYGPIVLPALTRALDVWRVAGVAPQAVRALPTAPLEAVDYLATTLQVNRERVRDAAGIPERTYFGWTSGRRPRERSVARLWAWVHVVSQLLQSRPTLAAWFHSDSNAQTAFDTGDVNAFIAAELSDSTYGVVHQPLVPFDEPAAAPGPQATRERRPASTERVVAVAERPQRGSRP